MDLNLCFCLNKHVKKREKLLLLVLGGLTSADI